LGDPVPISAYHNLGIDELMVEVIAHFPAEVAFPTPEADLKLAIVGRTNAGKSMLLNAITGHERSIVNERPGTTRDTVDSLVTYDGRSVLLIDTAGIRRRGSIERGIEKYSVLRAIRAIDRADVAVLLLDATELATDQDSHIANYILEAHRGIVLAVNKWDLAPELELDEEEATRKVRMRFKFATYAPLHFVSALRRSGVRELLDTAHAVYHRWSTGLPRYDLRRTILNAVAAHPPSPSGRRSLKIFGVTQDQTGPPSFTFYVNRSDMVHFSYQRYLENALRGAYDFEGSPLRMRFKGRGEA
jgi:GTP-binding protein